jgi:hypothetical protein
MNYSQIFVDLNNRNKINKLPLNKIVPKIIICNIPWVIMFFHISEVINDSNFE